MNAYQKMEAHLAEHAYKRGAYAGDAPADPSRRGRTHYRVVRDSATVLAVVFHYTQILRAHADGTVEINVAGYIDSPTTREALWNATAKFWRPTQLLSHIENGYRNHKLRVYGTGSCVFTGYGHFRSDGKPLFKPTPLKAYRSDREARKAWDEATAEFKQVFPLLFAGHVRQPVRYAPFPYSSKDLIADPQTWPSVVQAMAYQRRGTDAPDDPKKAWAELRRLATENLRVVVDLPVEEHNDLHTRNWPETV